MGQVYGLPGGGKEAAQVATQVLHWLSTLSKCEFSAFLQTVTCAGVALPLQRASPLALFVEDCAKQLLLAG